MSKTIRQISYPILAILTLMLTACSSTPKLAKTPNLFQNAAGYPAQTSEASERSSRAQILYVTDRARDDDTAASASYSKNRSASMGFGVANISIGDALGWDELVTISSNTDKRPSVEISSVTELGRFPPTPLTFSMTATGLQVDPQEKASYSQATLDFQNLVRERLKDEKTKDVIIYVHGFNNSFSASLLALTDVYHYTGRYGVPLVYSWPSGSGDLLGYFTDRESGEFTIYHFKETVRALASIPELENIHIIAHSRGTDVTTSSLRELVIESRAAGKDPRAALKIENLILAAPDLDYEVVKQRLIAEKFGPAFKQINIYMNEGDNALGISQFLMRGTRFGRLTLEEQSAREDIIFQNVGNVSFINVENVSGFVGHGYFRTHPGVLSDIIQVITKSAQPGSQERPLEGLHNNFWQLSNDYLLFDEDVINAAPAQALTGQAEYEYIDLKHNNKEEPERIKTG